MAAFPPRATMRVHRELWNEFATDFWVAFYKQLMIEVHQVVSLGHYVAAIGLFDQNKIDLPEGSIVLDLTDAAQVDWEVADGMLTELGFEPTKGGQIWVAQEIAEALKEIDRGLFPEGTSQFWIISHDGQHRVF